MIQYPQKQCLSSVLSCIFCLTKKDQKVKAVNVSLRSKRTEDAKQNKLTSFVGLDNILFSMHFRHFFL